MTTPEIRVAVVGAGRMGLDHIQRIGQRVAGARVSAIIETDPARAEAASQFAPGATIYSRIDQAISAGNIDAVLVATPGPAHESAILPALNANLPILCEKPLTEDSESSRRILDAEQKLDRPHIQVGFIRRFDSDYEQLKELISSKDAGELLMLRCVHRNPNVPDSYHQDMLVTDSLVHEFDAAPWLAGSDVKSIEIRFAKRNSLAPERLREPILAILELTNGVLVDAEMNVNAQFGYQVTTEAVFEKGLARIGDPAGLERFQGRRASLPIHAGHSDRFHAAFDEELQRWVDAVRNGTYVDGPNAWDGYKASLVCEAGVKALNDGGVIEVPLEDQPAFYA